MGPNTSKDFGETLFNVNEAGKRSRMQETTVQQVSGLLKKINILLPVKPCLDL